MEKYIIFLLPLLHVVSLLCTVIRGRSTIRSRDLYFLLVLRARTRILLERSKTARS